MKRIVCAAVATFALAGWMRADDLEDAYAKLKDTVQFKGAVCEGQEVPFDLALKMPTRQEAIAQIIGAILGPGAAIAGCLTGPASQVASQIQKISEKTEGAAAEAAPAAG